MISIGTSGYSYEDWRGPFYPEDLPRDAFLEFYSRRFDVVEINATYYAPPSVRMMEGLVRKSGGSVTFCVKASRRMTHERDADDALFDGFRAALGPLVEAGRLGAVLAQYPQSLKPDRSGRAALERVYSGLEGLPLVFEFRDRSWADERVFSWMQGRGVGLCCVDVPAIQSLFPPLVEVTSPNLAYMRCHGRNAASWYEHEEAYQRYDHRYTGQETREVAGAVRTLAKGASEVFVFYNNHYRAKAVDGAERLRRELAT
ncbi:MAG: DUF72 domain-containing protein [Deltaproteobacteria bacterium]|nr:DUF72 domain-containing protein [Deltaproteobacteria bacterium]